MLNILGGNCMSCSDIDFVVTWVDNSDPQWQNEFEQYKTDTVANEENSHIRYSEHGLLRYWFRGVEKFAPWVRKIHFVTNGQYPAWLNLNNSKLHFVRHSDYIDSKYLPLFVISFIDQSSGFIVFIKLISFFVKPKSNNVSSSSLLIEDTKNPEEKSLIL